MFKDFNIDEFGKTIITKTNRGKSITTDTEYWQLRNYIITRFCRNTDFWSRFKGMRLLDRVQAEKDIQKAIENKIDEQLKDKLRVEVLIIKTTAYVLWFQKILDINTKDKLLFDFNISI